MPSNTEIMRCLCEQMGIPWNDHPSQKEIEELHIDESLFEYEKINEQVVASITLTAHSFLINGMPVILGSGEVYIEPESDQALSAA